MTDARTTFVTAFDLAALYAALVRSPTVDVALAVVDGGVDGYVALIVDWS